MATITLAGDTISIRLSFVSGKYVIKINGAQVFVGPFPTRCVKDISVPPRTYRIARRLISETPKVFAYHVEVHQDGNVLCTGIFDRKGKQALTVDGQLEIPVDAFPPDDKAAKNRERKRRLYGMFGGGLGILMNAAVIMPAINIVLPPVRTGGDAVMRVGIFSATATIVTLIGVACGLAIASMVLDKE